MKKPFLSSLCVLIPLAIVCAIYVYLFSVSLVTVLVLAAILLIYGVLMALSWKNSKKAQRLQDGILHCSGTKSTIFKTACGISAPFYFCQFLLALFPLQHYAVWLLFLVPAMIVFSLPLGVVAEFCETFGIPKKFFWAVQVLIQLSFILLGRAASLFLVRFL